MRNLGFKQRLHMNNLRNADYRSLTYRDDKLSWRVCIALILFWCGAVWAGLAAWLS